MWPMQSTLFWHVTAWPSHAATCWSKFQRPQRGKHSSTCQVSRCRQLHFSCVFDEVRRQCSAEKESNTIVLRCLDGAPVYYAYNLNMLRPKHSQSFRVPQVYCHCGTRHAATIWYIGAAVLLVLLRSLELLASIFGNLASTLAWKHCSIQK